MSPGSGNITSHCGWWEGDHLIPSHICIYWYTVVNQYPKYGLDSPITVIFCIQYNTWNGIQSMTDNIPSFYNKIQNFDTVLYRSCSVSFCQRMPPNFILKEERPGNIPCNYFYAIVYGTCFNWLHRWSWYPTNILFSYTFKKLLRNIKGDVILCFWIRVSNVSFNNISVIYRGSPLYNIGGGNRSTRRKPSTCRKSLTNLMLYHNVCGGRHWLHR